MKQIDIKKPKYIIPILILPFILGIGWLVKDMINSAPAEETTLVETEELNLDIPDANLEKREIKSKFESLKGAFNKSSDYSSIQTIDKEEEVSEIESSGSLYSNDEIRQIDSLNQASRIREKELEQQIKGFPTIDESSQTETRKAPEKSKMQEEMELFKMQMAYIDSLQNPRPRTPQKKQDEKPKEKAIEVVKAKNPAEVYFNTVACTPPRCSGVFSCRTSSPSVTLPQIVRQSKSWSRWGMSPALPVGARTGSPSTSTSPPDGCSMPAMSASSVDFPQPDGPTMLTNSPSATPKVTSRSAATSPSGA